MEIQQRISLESNIKTKLTMLSILQTNNPNIDAQVDQKNSALITMRDLNRRYQLQIADWVRETNDQIDIVAAQLYTNNTYKFSVDQLNDEVSFGQVLGNDLTELVTTRIKSYCDWHYAGLQIGCRFKQWTDCMVTSDPLYLTNYYKDMIDRVTTTYPEVYQRRLRTYPIAAANLAEHLPNNQFGFILAWEYLNYATREEIRQVITQVWSLLRPGGMFMFSYNNCDLTDSARLAEIGAMSYIRKQHLLELLINLGFQIVHVEDHSTTDPLYTHISWFEVRKPGHLITSKSHQVLGKIIEK